MEKIAYFLFGFVTGVSLILLYIWILVKRVESCKDSEADWWKNGEDCPY
jgi:hypothetical protein